MEICSQFSGSNALLAQAKKSIEQIKQEQAKPSNNQLSTIFQILKPIDLQGQCAIAQQIDKEFWKGAISRDARRIEEERKERKERAEKKKGD